MARQYTYYVLCWMLVDVEKVQRITFHGRSCCYQLVNYRSRCRRPRRPSKNRLAKYSISFFGCQTALPSRPRPLPTAKLRGEPTSQWIALLGQWPLRSRRCSTDFNNNVSVTEVSPEQELAPNFLFQSIMLVYGLKFIVWGALSAQKFNKCEDLLKLTINFDLLC